MSTELKDLEGFIDKLKSAVTKPDFETQLLRETPDLPEVQRFLLKIELRRLASDCSKPVDLRETFGDDCEPYKVGGLIHHLDQISKEIFDKEIAAYGRYTTGVYEQLMDVSSEQDVEEKRKQAKEKKEGFTDTNEDDRPDEELLVPVEIVPFGEMHHRDEERMNFATPIELITGLNEHIQATTIDISMSGCRVKVPRKHMINQSEKMRIIFLGLIQEYNAKIKAAVQYEVVEVVAEGEDKRIRLRRTFIEHDPGFEQFLSKFIQGNKRRYKVNLDNTVQSIISKGYQQYFLPRMAGLPIYFNRTQKGKIEPRFMLSTDNNKDLINYWRDENGKSMITGVINDMRLQRLLALPGKVKQTYLYAFNLVSNGKLLFFCGTLEELRKDPRVYKAFLGFGASKEGFRVYSLTLTDVASETAHLPNSLPDSVSEEAKKDNKPLPPRLMAYLKDICYIAQLTEITSESSGQRYRKLLAGKVNPAIFKPFALRPVKLESRFDEIRYKYINLRSEDRYMFKTPVEIDVDGVVQKGVTNDFSIKGISVQFEEPFPFDVNAMATVSFPDLQKMTKKYDLQHLSYKVVSMRSDRSSISMASVEGYADNDAKGFFASLIQSNKKRLEVSGGAKEIPGLDVALCNIYNAHMMSMPFFIAKDTVNHIPSTIAIPPHKADLVKLLRFGMQDKEKLNLYCLQQSKVGDKTILESIMRRMDRESRPTVNEILIRFEPDNRTLARSITARYMDEFPTEQDKLNFIQKTLQTGYFYAVRMTISKTGRPDTDFIAAELSYVHNYASHKGKVLEEQLWQTAGVGEFVDITKEMLLRFGIEYDGVTGHLRKREELKVR